MNPGRSEAIVSADTALRRGNRNKSVISIVGAGPAGLACAIVLARADYPVVVHEQHSKVGGRFHGDFQGLENWSSEEDILDELARSGIERSFECRAVYGGTAKCVGFEDFPVKSPVIRESTGDRCDAHGHACQLPCRKPEKQGQ